MQLKLGDGIVGGSAQTLVNDTKDTAQKATQDPNTRRAVAAYFAGQAVGANVFTRATGTVVNPNLELSL